MRKLVITSACLVMALSGCSGGGDDKDDDQSPEDRLAEAKTSFDDAGFIGFSMSTEDLPDGVQGLISADGTGTHDPAFTGEVKVRAGTEFTAGLIAVDGTVYLDPPIIGWSEIDPAEYGAPDPAKLMDTSSGISSLFTATQGATTGDSERDGSEVLTTIDGTIPGDAVKAIFPSAGSDDFDVTYTLTSGNDIDKAEVTGPFYGDDPVTYSLDFDLDADSVEIEAPN